MDINKKDRLLKAMEAAEIAWWEMRLPSGIIKFGKVKTDVLGYNQKDFKYYKDFTKLVDPVDYEPMMQNMRDHISGKNKVYEALFRINAKDGTQKLFYDRGKIVERNGKDIVIMGMTTNMETINSYAYKIAREASESTE